MGMMELFLIAVGLSMDAFAVSVCKGLAMRAMNRRHALVIALFFGVFQALMPLIGWALGRQFESYIVNIDHFVAFGLLAFIGGRMVLEAVRGADDCPTSPKGKLDLRQLFVLAIATSIDALAVGITFAFLKADIALSASMIGVTTFLLSLLGVFIGHRYGSRFKKKAEIAGGVILILIGLKILIEHLMAP